MTAAVIEAALPADAPAILSLLERCGLPTAGWIDHLGETVVARLDGAVVGSAALEIYEDGALLRSVAADARVRGTGIGGRLTEAVLAAAKARGVSAVYLLTTTAEEFFPRFGFDRISRVEVPTTVQQSIEFTSACPASATVMRKKL
jgi:amino-acid N-acetyltransferase